MALNAIPGFRCAVLCGVVGGFQVSLGFWCGGGFAAGVGGAQRDGSGCHEAEGADEQGPLESGVAARRRTPRPPRPAR
jgi:hypothetical protein